MSSRMIITSMKSKVGKDGGICIDSYIAEMGPRG
jgi:hypothetical protein